MKQNQKGITIVGLLITVIVIVTIAGVCIYTGKDILEEAKLEQLKTNMLLIQAKCQSVGERVTAKELTAADYIGTSTDFVVEGITIETDDKWYGLTEKDIEEQEYIKTVDGVELTKTGVGLGNIVNEEDENKYLYYFNYKDNEVVYAAGYNGKYTLTQILGTDAE